MYHRNSLWEQCCWRKIPITLTTLQEGAGEAPGGIREVSAIQTASETAPTGL
jgi:hypothetical protein